MNFAKLVSRGGKIVLSAIAAGAATAVLGAAPAGAHRAARSLAPERIRELLPSSLGALARGDSSAESNAVLGIQLSQAEAQYRDNDGHYVTLRIEDAGGPDGLRSLVPWASVREGKPTASGDGKTYRFRGRRVHEKWDPPAGPNAIGYGEYAVIVGKRFLVEASGRVAGIGVLKSAVGRVDLAKLDALKSSGASAN